MSSRRLRTREEKTEYFNIQIRNRSISERQAIVDKICLSIGRDKVQVSGTSSVVDGVHLSDDLVDEILAMLDQFIKNDLIDFSDL